MVGSQCRVVATFGGGIARSILTMRISPKPGEADALRDWLTRACCRVSPAFRGSPAVGAALEQLTFVYDPSYTLGPRDL
jgi:hypothetical protein